MKGKICKILVLILLFTSIGTTMAFGQDMGLEEAIHKAKEKVNIPNQYEKFNYNVYTISDKKIWGMNWVNEKTNESIHVSVNEDGDMVSYRYYDGKYNKENKIPRYSKDEAIKEAKDFIKEMDPNLLDEVKYEYDKKEKLPVRKYSMFFYRVIDDIPFYENGIEVSVDSDTGKVISYNKMWDTMKFPSNKNIISEDKAKEIFKKDLGLELVYKFKYEEDVVKPYLAYVLKYDRQNSIDANTGKVVKADYYYIDYPRYGNVTMKEDKAAVRSLSPEEQKAVDSSKDIMSKEKAEKIARSIDELNIGSEYKLENANIYKVYPQNERFKWELYFKKEEDKKYDYVNVSLDAKDGKVLSFYKGREYTNEKGKYEKEEAKKMVEKFLEKFSIDYKNTAYKEYDEVSYENIEMPGHYTFTYRRLVNNIPVRDNFIRVTFNNVTGEIQSYNLNWFDVKFPTGNTISLDEAYDIMFKEMGMELNFRRRYEKPKLMPANKNCNVALVYSIKGHYPVIYDGITGKLLDYNGKPIIIENEENSKTISGHKYEKEMNGLSEYGILSIEEGFNPDSKILQKDFLKLTLNAVGQYYKKDDMDEMYRVLMNKNIIKEEEKNPEGMVTEQEAAKFIVRALGYEEIAKLGDIFKYPYNPNAVDEEYIGYITIANKLSIIKDEFKPNSDLTNGRSAYMIYNYLTR
ncbi:YcdB/YcdC domain-containing protein [Anaeromicrobium sediminis]|nr:YcdB/YcdC domain-containing protein [Anaeromicrobium sediminis]